MYSQQELDDAVASGAITADAANALRLHIENQRETVIPDEEQFRLITGFNDIFVSIAAAILLFAVGWIGQSIGQSAGMIVDHDGPSFLAPLGVAAAAWGLAIYFTAKRRMALPSILLLLAFVGGVFLTVGFGLVQVIGEPPEAREALYIGIVASVSGAVAAAAAWLHWTRFRVPITVAAGAASVAAIAVGLLIAALGRMPRAYKNLILGFVLMLGIGMFLFAMWWDASDRARLTRRSDVAFWLHLLAAPMIVHPVFTLLGLNDGNATIGEGFVVIAALRRPRPHGSGDRPPRAARLGARLRAVRAAAAVPPVRRGRAQRRADGAGHRLGAADAVGLLAPGARGDGPAAAGGLRDRLPMVDRTAGGYPTSRISRRSSGARTPSSSWPRLSTAPCSPTKCKRPLLQPKRGAFLDADFGPLGMAAKGREHRHVGIDPQRIIAPVAGGDHPTVEVEDAGKLRAFEVAIGRRSQGAGNGAMTLKRS